MSLKKIITLIAFSPLLMVQVSQAQKTGNGGDICAFRVLDIGNDILSWIAKGGADDLNLPTGVTLVDYKTKMFKAIKSTKVSCTDKIVRIGESERTCINFKDKRKTNRIVCNRSAFENSTTEAEQYTLIHHEYAGVAGFEKDIASETSNVVISNQISENLEEQMVLKLGIKGQTTSHSNSQTYVLSGGGSNNDYFKTYCQNIQMNVTVGSGNQVTGAGTNGNCSEAFTGTLKNGILNVAEFSINLPNGNIACNYSGSLYINNDVLSGTLTELHSSTPYTSYNGYSWCSGMTINGVKIN